MKIDELTTGNIYTCINYGGKAMNNFVVIANNTSDFWTFVSTIDNSLDSKEFSPVGLFGISDDFRESTDLEKQFLLDCIQENRFIENYNQYNTAESTELLEIINNTKKLYNL